MSPFRNRDQRVLSGPEAVKQATGLRALVSKHEQWPYDWVFPPKNAKPWNPFASIVAPAVGVATTILETQVPTGFDFIMEGMLQWFQGTGFIPGSGDALWDTLLNPGTQNLAVEGLGQIPFNLGSLTGGTWWRFPEAYRFTSLDIIRNQVTTTVDIAPGAPNYFITMFLGWLYPTAPEVK